MCWVAGIIRYSISVGRLLLGRRTAVGYSRLLLAGCNESVCDDTAIITYYVPLWPTIAATRYDMIMTTMSLGKCHDGCVVYA